MHRSWKLAAAAASATIVVVACGSSSGGDEATGTPKEQLVAGISHLGDADVLTTTLSLDTSAEDLQAVAKSGGDKLSMSSADAITSAQLVFETTKDKTFSLRAVDNGTTLFELRVVAKTIYLHGDLESLLDIVGKPEVLASIRQQTAQMPDFVQAFVAGRWISLNSEALSGLIGQSGGGSASAAPESTAGPKLLADLRETVGRDITVKDLGSTSDGEHLQLSGDTRKLVADLQQAVRTDVPGGAALGDRLNSADVPSRTIVLDAYLDDDRLAKLSLDLAQFDDDNELPAGTTLPLVLTFAEEGDEIAAPSDSVPVDLTQLGSLLGALSGGSV